MNICIPNKRLDMNFLNFAFCTYFSNGELKPFGCTKSLCVRYKVVLIKNEHCWFHPVRFRVWRYSDFKLSPGGGAALLDYHHSTTRCQHHSLPIRLSTLILHLLSVMSHM